MFFYAVIGIIYVLLTGLLCYFNYKKNLNNKEKKYKIFYVLAFIFSLLPLGLVAGIRYNVGTDYWHTYAPHFVNIFDGNYHYSEKTFEWLNMLLRLITDDPVWLFLLMAFTFITFIQLSIVKVSDNWLISSILVIASNIFFVSLNQSRQMVAVAILMYAFTFVLEKRICHFLIFVLIATCFHYSSLIMIPFYFIVNIKFVKKYAFYILLGIIALLPMFQFILKWAVGLTKYSYYLTDSQYNTEQFIAAYFIMAFVVELAGIIFYNKFDDNAKSKAYPYLVMNGVALIIGILGFFITIPELMARTYLLFSWSQIFIVPIIFSQIKGNKLKYSITTIVTVAMLLCTLYIILVQKHHEIIPYNWIFSK